MKTLHSRCLSHAFSRLDLLVLALPLRMLALLFLPEPAMTHRAAYE